MSATASTATQPKPLEWLNRLRANPRIPLIVAGSAAVAIVVAMVLWAKTPDYRTLFSNLSDQDGGAIVAQLTQMNIPYRFANGSGAIEVPADKVHELRLRLAQQGLPKGGAVGFELLDQEKFGISQFSEQVNYQRALEGELARTIETLGPVKSARVHLAMPKPSLFVREQKSPSASVTVTLEPGRRWMKDKLAPWYIWFPALSLVCRQETSLWSINPVICSRNPIPAVATLMTRN